MDGTTVHSAIAPFQAAGIRYINRIVPDVDVSVEGLRVESAHRRQCRVGGGEPAVIVAVHPGLGEVQSGLVVLFVAGETLTDVVGAAQGILERLRAPSDPGPDLFAERHKITPGNDVP